ncbi:glycosyl transferase family 1 [Sphingopyxis terrae subsp. terrae NBRC 15098]|uniref:Glycosyl transferase family 1 n=1 Tax=Sphingopyxis terrae subsp. terrae NBRC 15098 TaxID=1219058 RepID=A0A142VVP5_9SPHN|nr:glycosyltransferase family 4 protein [Sphingopyxis terrae]AMU93866.1 glycosyl transferase family 1 [Sphingopyxis terrae subsp. terrae NBRC 15098]QXF11289.1 glycosyltransferase [Sphingopyxis terrae subsp. terrae]
MALVGGFIPRRCGIATFTADVRASLAEAAPDLVVDVYAMAPAAAPILFDPVVRGIITEGDVSSFIDAARQIEASCADIVWLQHEFGLFGGSAGDMILELVDRVAAPLVVTLHTVLAEPDADQRRVMDRLIARAARIFVMSERSGDLLRSVYRADEDQIALIAHGVPDRPFGRASQFKPRFGFAGKQVALTFGLLSPGKGIEAVIEALPAIVEDHPDFLYCIAGATHPNLLAHEGEAYRDRLEALAVSLGVDAHVRWIDAFMETDDLLDLLEAADIYITPYTGAQQSTSGTLAYAVALGKAVISTPYVHAVELLADNHGVLVPFNDSEAIANEVRFLLGDADRLRTLQGRAYDRGRDMIWPAFAERSCALIAESRVVPKAAPIPDRIGIEGFLRICDDTGILQHSVHMIPDRAHGYCVDDNARALMLMHRLGEDALGRCGQLATVFAAFVQHAWNPDRGEFRNFMGFGGNWLEDVGSEDSCGRTLWALGATARDARDPGLRQWALELFERTAASALDFGSPRAIAFALLGADFVLAGHPEHDLANRLLRSGAERLNALYGAAARPDWQWFEPVLAYDNCRLPEAMLRAGVRLERADVTACGVATLRWINDLQIAPHGHYRPIGSDCFGQAYALPRPFDQQPLEVWAAIDAASAAYDVTGDDIWLAHARRAYEWFTGANDRGVIVGDVLTGTSKDGINPRGLNLNEGAESVLAYQHATYSIRDFIRKVD